MGLYPEVLLTFLIIYLGSVPFLLREHLSYSQLAVFALSGYPYSLKLLWSPIVDSVFLPSIGRRKSWIIPMQLIIGTLMFYISRNVDALLEKVKKNLVISTAFPDGHLISARRQCEYAYLCFHISCDDLGHSGHRGGRCGYSTPRNPTVSDRLIPFI
jgi:hypothetical protein